MSYHSLDNRKITIRPDLEQTSYWFYEKPTLVYRGVHRGYSFPVYNSDDEELRYTTRIPYRWNGTSNPIVKLYVWTASAEDVGDTFKFQLDYQSENGSGVISDSNSIIYFNGAILEGRIAQYSKYTLTAELNKDNISVDEIMSGRLRRIASDGTQISGEVIARYMVIEYPVDKCFGEWT